MGANFKITKLYVYHDLYWIVLFITIQTITNVGGINLKRGFTLLEMIVVMGGIVALFLLTVPNIIKTMSVVNDASCDAQLKVVDSAILQYKIKFDTYPNTTQQLVSEGFLTSSQLSCKNGMKIGIVDGQASK